MKKLIYILMLILLPSFALALLDPQLTIQACSALFFAGNPCELSFDGDTGTYWRYGIVDKPPPPQNITYEFTNKKNITELRMFHYQSAGHGILGIDEFEMWGSDDDITFTLFETIIANGSISGTWKHYGSLSVIGKYIRISVIDGGTDVGIYESEFFGLTVIDVTPVAPSTSTYNVTSKNQISGQSTTSWNNVGAKGIINITNNTLTGTLVTDVLANCSGRFNVSGNYTENLAFNAQTQFASTDETDHSFLAYENISLGENCYFISCVASGNISLQNNTGESTSGCLNLTLLDIKAPIWIDIPANKTIEYFIDSLSVDFNATDLYIGNFTINDTTNFNISNDGVMMNITSLAIANYYINVSVNDTSGNINQTIFNVNVTDTKAPRWIDIPNNISIFNTTNISLDFNATDNFAIDTYFVNDSNFIISATGIFENNTVLGVANYTINVSVNDTSGNVNSTVFNVNITAVPFIPSGAVTLFFDGLNESRKYEYFTSINITATISSGEDICFDILDNSARYLNYSCGSNVTYLIDKLLLNEFNDSTTSKVVNSANNTFYINIDNRTELVELGFNLSGISGPGVPCYQEFANISVCGGLNPGGYAFQEPYGSGSTYKAWDGDWSTFATSGSFIQILFMNYSIPTSTTGANVSFKCSTTADGAFFNFSSFNYTLNAFNSGDIKLQCTSTPTNYTVVVGNDSLIGEFLQLKLYMTGSPPAPDPRFSTLYEEAVSWETSGYPFDVKINLGGDSRIDAVIPGKLIQSEYLIQNFILDDINYNALNISFTSKSSKTITLNITSAGDKENNGTLNFTIKAFDLDESNEFNFPENFSVERSGGIINSTENTSIPSIYDNFVTNATYNKYNWNTHFTGIDFSPDHGINISGNGKLRCFASLGDNGKEVCSVGDKDIDLRRINQLDFQVQSNIGCRKGNEVTTTQNDIGYYGEGNEEFISFIKTNLPCRYPDAIFSSYDRHYSIYFSDPNTLVAKYDDVTVSKSIASLEGPIRLVFRSQVNLQGDRGPPNAFSSAEFLVDYINISGISLNRNTDAFSPLKANWTSELLVTTQDNISRAKFISQELLQNSFTDNVSANTSIRYWLSNNNGSTWEIAFNDTFRAFESVNNSLKIRIEFQTNNSLVSPLITDLLVQIIPAGGCNLNIDIGEELDGTIPTGGQDMKVGFGLNASTTPIFYNGTDASIRGFDCSDQGLTCEVPIRFTVNQSCQLEITNMNYTKNLNPINLTNLTGVEDLDKIPIELTIIQGEVTVDDLGLQFFGSHNITILATQIDKRSNNVSHVVQVRYSPFNFSYPSIATYWINEPSGRNQSNIQPYGQNLSRGIWQVNSTAYDDPFNLYVRFNESFDTCVSYVNFSGVNNTATPDLNQSLNISLNTSYQVIIDSMNDTLSQDIWTFTDILCGGSNTNNLIIPYFCFKARCGECVNTFDFQAECDWVE